MSDLNQCNFIGRLGRDPDVKYLPSGDQVASFSIACGWKTKDKEGVEWISVNAFGRLAEIVAEYCTKGKQIYVSGRYMTRKWQDNEGNDRYSTQINADRIQLLGSKNDGDYEKNTEPEASKPSAKTKGGGFDEMENDIPF